MKLYNAKSEDRNHHIGEMVSFEVATGNRAFHGNGIYLSDRVEIAYTRGSGCVYVIDGINDVQSVKKEEMYEWYLTQQVDYQVVGVEVVAVEQALSHGWKETAVQMIKEMRESVKLYHLKLVS